MNRPKLVYLFCIFLTLYHLTARVGLAIDLQWHLDVGRDSLLTPPHVMILAGAPFCILFSFYYVFLNTSDHNSGTNMSGIKILGFIAPGSIWMILLGMLSLGVGGIYDDYWHAQYPFDMGSWKARATTLSEQSFISKFSDIFENGSWIIEEAFKLELGPSHNTSIGLHNAFCRIFRTASLEKKKKSTPT